MKEETYQRVEELKEKIRNYEDRIFDLYIEHLIESFPKYSYKDKRRVEKGLEGLIFLIENPPKKGEVLKKSNFNKELAKEIRKKYGYSQIKLVEELEKEGINKNTLRSEISRWERGRSYPSENSKTGKMYLSWLKQKGYMNLED